MAQAEGARSRAAARMVAYESRDSLVRSLRHWEEGIQDQAFRRLVMRTKTKGFAVCLRNSGFAASLEVRKLYPVIEDPRSGRERSYPGGG
jgi:hypothetical protein